MRNNRFIKVKDHPNLVRDRNTKAIINIDDEGLNKYKKERERLLKIKNAVDSTETIKAELENTKQELAEMKQLLLALMEKK